MRLFDRSEPGAWVSVAAHAALLTAAIVGFTWESFPEIQEGIPVEVVSDSMFAEMTRGDQKGEVVQPDLKPRVDQVAETVEERDPGEAATAPPSQATRTAEMKVAAREADAAPPPPAPPRREVAKVEPPPAPPRREPEPKPEPKREDAAAKAAERAADAKAEAEAKVKAEAEARQRAEDALEKAEAKAAAEREKAAAKAKAEREKAEAKAVSEAEARERAEAEAKAIEKAKALADAKALAEAKRQAEAKAEAEANAKRQAELADKFNLGAIRNLLAAKEPAPSAGSTGRELQRTAAIGTATGTSLTLNPSQLNALVGHIRDQINAHYSQIPGSRNDAVTNPVMEVRLNPDGSLAAEPRLLQVGSKPIDRAVAEAALRAVRKAAPFRIPAQFAPYYASWKVLKPEFTPE